jgi:hypothetical protein
MRRRFGVLGALLIVLAVAGIIASQVAVPPFGAGSGTSEEATPLSPTSTGGYAPRVGLPDSVTGEPAFQSALWRL